MIGKINTNLGFFSKLFSNKLLFLSSKTALYIGLAVYWALIVLGTYISVI